MKDDSMEEGEYRFYLMAWNAGLRSSREVSNDL
jgi:hypothetical protein